MVAGIRLVSCPQSSEAYANLTKLTQILRCALFRFFKNLACSAEAFKPLRNATINRDHMYNGADLVAAHTVVECAFAVKFPLVHFAQSTDHGEVHHRAGLCINDIIAPAKAPAPSRHRFLERTGEVVGCREIFLDIVCAQCGLTLLQTFQKQVLIKTAHGVSSPSTITICASHAPLLFARAALYSGELYHSSAAA